MAEKAKSIISKAKEKGVTVISYGQDMGSSNTATQNALWVSVNSNTGMATPNTFNVDGDDVACICDGPHLLKN